MPETGELIAGIIGALVGAFAALLSTIYLEHKKDVENKRGIKDIILSDLEMQVKLLKQYAFDFNHLKLHLKSDKAFSDKYDGKHNAYLDNVYKSNTMIEYNAAFGKDIFLEFQVLYEKLIIFKQQPASKVWLEFQARHTYIWNDPKSTKKFKEKTVYENRDYYIEMVDSGINNCRLLLIEIGKLRPKIESLKFPFFKNEDLFKTINIFSFWFFRLLLYIITLMLLIKIMLIDFW